MKAKRSSKKKSTKWGCSEGCDVSKTICKHLEAKLPQYHYGSIATSEGLDNRIAAEPEESILDRERKYRDYENKLAKLGFKEYEIKLIMDRFVSNMSISEIAKRHGYLTTTTVVRMLGVLKEALKYVYEQKGMK